jgi:hypothetical protein
MGGGKKIPAFTGTCLLSEVFEQSLQRPPDLFLFLVGKVQWIPPPVSAADLSFVIQNIGAVGREELISFDVPEYVFHKKNGRLFSSSPPADFAGTASYDQ